MGGLRCRLQRPPQAGRIQRPGSGQRYVSGPVPHQGGQVHHRGIRCGHRGVPPHGQDSQKLRLLPRPAARRRRECRAEGIQETALRRDGPLLEPLQQPRLDAAALCDAAAAGGKQQHRRPQGGGRRGAYGRNDRGTDGQPAVCRRQRGLSAYEPPPGRTTGADREGTPAR